MKTKELIVSYLKRKWWYVLLLFLSTIYVFYYKNEINQFKDFDAVNLIFIVWLALLLHPLFSEMEFFGIKFKKEMEKAKNEVKETLNDLRMQIMDLKITNSNANTINFGNGFLPSEEKLKELIKEFISNTNPIKENLNGNEPAPKTEISIDTTVSNNANYEIDDESTYLFKTRLVIEKALTDLCEKTGYNGHKSMFEMLRHLNKCEIINGKTADLINQIIKIANRGVHGEIVSSEYVDFIKRVFPELKKQLYEINTQLHYYTCSRCKYSGYSRFDNVCPICGNISDD